jgi:hypothetical protein
MKIIITGNVVFYNYPNRTGVEVEAIVPKADANPIDIPLI